MTWYSVVNLTLFTVATGSEKTTGYGLNTGLAVLNCIMGCVGFYAAWKYLTEWTKRFFVWLVIFVVLFLILGIMSVFGGAANCSKVPVSSDADGQLDRDDCTSTVSPQFY